MLVIMMTMLTIEMLVDGKITHGTSNAKNTDISNKDILTPTKETTEAAEEKGNRGTGQTKGSATLNVKSSLPALFFYA